MNSERELRNHLIWEFYAGNPNSTNILKESRGVVSGVGDITDYLTTKIEPMVKKLFSHRLFSKNSVNKTIKGVVPENIHTFFKNYTLNVHLERNRGNRYNGGINPSNSFIDTEKGLILEPYIDISVYGKDKEWTLNVIRVIIGHELTHGYNLLQYGLKNGKTRDEIINNVFVGQRYSAIQTATNASLLKTNKAAVGNILYSLNRMERNAYLAQLKQELESMNKQIIDAKSAMRCIEKTDSWARYKSVEENIGAINNITDAYLQSTIINSTNEVMNTNFTTFNQVKNYYNRRWNNWKKKFITTASKIAHDIFDKYHNQSLDGNMSEYTKIRQK